MNPSTERHPAVALIYFLLAVVVGMVLVTLLLRFSIINRTDRLLREAADQFAAEQANADPANAAVLAQAELTLIRAQDAVESVNLILSFLEGASVLTGLLIAGLGYFGLSRFNELDKEKKTLEELVEKYKPSLEKLDENVKRAGNLEQKINDYQKRSLDDLYDLTQAGQELRIKNYDEAHYYAIRVLERLEKIGEQPNVQALYLAGWLELQFIKQHGVVMLDEGVEKLEQALKYDPESNSIQAALGVGFRRQARHHKEGSPERKRQLEKARLKLEEALLDNPKLIDLNSESFWGPVAGCYRDLGDLKKAIECYREALKVTPNSSYPKGNLAALLLEDGQYKEAVQAFYETVRLAQSEITSNPNDYYAMMDIAMSNSMLTDAELFKQEGYLSDKQLGNIAEAKAEVEKWLGLAFESQPTAEMINVSLGGWRRLRDHTKMKGWETIYNGLQAIVQRMEAKEQELNAAKSTSVAS